MSIGPRFAAEGGKDAPTSPVKPFTGGDSQIMRRSLSDNAKVSVPVVDLIELHAINGQCQDNWYGYCASYEVEASRQMTA